MSEGMEELEGYLDPVIEAPDDVQLVDILPRGYLSVSQGTTFMKCGRSWYLRYVEGKKTKPSARMFQGIQVHKAVERILNVRLNTGMLPPLDEATDVFSTAFEEQKPLIEDWEDQSPDAVKDMGVNCTKTFYTEAASKAMPVYVEKAFHTTISVDGKIHLPVFGRIDSIQVAALNEKEYQAIREELVDNYAAQTAEGAAELKLPVLRKPRRIHDLKVVSDKWSEADLENDMQFALYAGVEGIPDVQVDQIVKGRSKIPRTPRYEVLNGVVSQKFIKHTVHVFEDVAKSIATGHFPRTDPGNWWCSEKWCSVWQHCRGADKQEKHFT